MRYAAPRKWSTRRALFFVTFKISEKMKTIVAIAATAVAALLFFAQCQVDTANAHPQATATAPKPDPVERGKYLVNTIGCDDCHTPKVMTPQGPVPDMNRRLMGHPSAEPFSNADKKAMIQQQHVAVFSAGMTAIAGEWGVSFAANLTPDESGIGNWTEAQFLKAIREGKSKGLDGTRPLLPPMPWPVYAKMNDDDLKAIFAYLRTQKPIRNVVPNPVPM